MLRPALSAIALAGILLTAQPVLADRPPAASEQVEPPAAAVTEQQVVPLALMRSPESNAMAAPVGLGWG